MTALSKPLPFGINRRNWPYFLLGLVVVLALLAPIDHVVSVTAHAWPEPFAGFFATITELGLSDWILIPSLALFVVCMALALISRREQSKAALFHAARMWAFVFIGVGLPGLVANIAKRLIGRARPVVYDGNGTLAFQSIFNDWQFQSFPSGHSTTIFAFAMVVSFLWPKLFWPAIVVAVLVGVSRLAVGMHYPTDVVAGAVLGTMGAYLVRLYFARRGWVFARAADGSVERRKFALQAG